MKKTWVLSTLFTLSIIFLPPFLMDLDKENKEINSDDVKVIQVEHIDTDSEKNKYQDDITTFYSNTSFKKTYYISGDRVNVYSDSSGSDKLLRYLRKNDVIVAYNERNGYIYCEDNNGRFGWVRKNKDNLSGEINKKTTYKVDVDLTKQLIFIYKDNKELREIKCSTGLIGNADTETPVGNFEIQNKGTFFFSPKYNQGGKYYIKFFSNYLIHSIPTDKNGNIIEEEKDKLGVPVSHGCIRVPVEESKWIYDNIPVGSAVSIHY
ncbi:L,D-transpeptidase [Clostridium swellfunianum]|uniref:L,D-transpeptidase family protein n=1 Tax=Clostridium swellfunianum TaxID=1367462 RepID=UPI0020309D94|nr:L,D-transpeptidase [Clostridium swellfunianum]MCM0649378.1 L,D-transpeptidase [Clostridium swellfunianum]